MKLINTDGMVFIGPGSEWFWTALTGIVLAVTFVAIYHQLRVARGASALAQLDSFTQQWTSERMVRFQFEVLVAVRNGADPAHLPIGAAVALANFWDTQAGITRRGHVDLQLFWIEYGTVCESWWVTLAPFIRVIRAAEANSTVWGTFEWLAGDGPKLDRRFRLPSFPEAWTPSALERRIAICRDLIRVAEALRTVVVAQPRTGSVVQPAPPAPTETTSQ